MTRIERMELAISRGYRCDSDGTIYGFNGGIMKGGNERYKYFFVKFNKKSYKIPFHHFVYYYFNKNSPDRIDHKNRNSISNNLSNLRESNVYIDTRNREHIGYSTIKYKSGTVRFRAGISINGKKKHLGMFDTKEEAREAYIAAKRIYHTEYT